MDRARGGTMGEESADGVTGDDAAVDAEASWALPGNRFTRRVKIYAVAAKVGARYGAANRPGLSDGHRAKLVARANRRGARDLYERAVHLRGSSLTLAQFVSARPDLSPPAYVEELS